MADGSRAMWPWPGQPIGSKKSSHGPVTRISTRHATPSGPVRRRNQSAKEFTGRLVRVMTRDVPCSRDREKLTTNSSRCPGCASWPGLEEVGQHSRQVARIGDVYELVARHRGVVELVGEQPPGQREECKDEQDHLPGARAAIEPRADPVES